MDLVRNADRSNKSKRLPEKYDIFDIGTRKSKGRKRPRNNTQNAQMHVRVVLPAEQMTAIAKSILDRQAKPKDLSIPSPKEISIIGREVTQKGREKRKTSKKAKREAPSIELI